METCHFEQGCPVMERRFSKLPGIAHLFRTRYCDGDHGQCARHRLAELLGTPAVPDGLMPNDHLGAARLSGRYVIPN